MGILKKIHNFQNCQIQVGGSKIKDRNKKIGPAS